MVETAFDFTSTLQSGESYRILSNETEVYQIYQIQKGLLTFTFVSMNNRNKGIGSSKWSIVANFSIAF